MTIDQCNQEPRQQQDQQSLSQALLLSYEGLSLPRRLPRQQPFTRMDRQEQRTHLRATIELALEITSGVDASIFDNPVGVSSVPMSQSNGENNAAQKQ
jgi:hypothetical protein